jgi:hypothetical protein
LAVDGGSVAVETGGSQSASTRSSRAEAAIPDFVRSLSLSLMVISKCLSGQQGKRQRRDKGLKLELKKIIIIIIIELKSLCIRLICFYLG